MSSLRPILQYPEEKLTQALDAIRNGMSIREASRTFSVPRGTLQDRLHLRVPEGPRRMGPESVLNKHEEAEIATWLKNLAICGFPIKPDNLLNTVQQIMVEDGRPNPFVNGRPGKKWLSSFFRRNKSISMRTPEAISKGRAIITEENIRKWFVNLNDYLAKIQALDVIEDPTRIFNGDETSFMLCPKTGKVIAPRGYKNVYQIVKGKEKEAVTVLAFFSAIGDILPPCVVFPYIRPPKDVINSMPDGWFLGKSDTGWMKADIFYDYIAKCLNKWIEDNNVKKPVLVFVDGHKTHMTLKLSKYCYDNNIILYALPPNTTHMMQPADVSVFKPLKSEWSTTVHEWSSRPENANTVLTKSSLCPLLDVVLSKETLKETVKNGFRKCGLYPFDPNAVDYSKCVQNNLENIKNKSQSIKTPTKSLKKRDFSIASKVIKHLEVNLTVRGIDVKVLLEIIENEKIIQGLNDSVRSNTAEKEVENGGKNLIVEENTKLHLAEKDRTAVIQETEIKRVERVVDITEEQNNDQDKTEINLTDNKINNSIDINSSQFQILHIDTDNLNTLALGDLTFFNNNLSEDKISLGNFEVNDNSILIPLRDSASNQNIQPVNEQNYDDNIQNNSSIKITYQKVSPFVQKHLTVPSPIKKSSTTRVMNRIGAISSEEWRQFEISKEYKKQKKKDAIQERKLQRQRQKEEKEKQKNEKKKQIALKTLKKKIKKPTIKEDDYSNEDFRLQSTKKRKLIDRNDTVEKAKKMSFDLVESKTNKINVLSDILISPTNTDKKEETCKQTKIHKKIVNRKDTFGSEKELENFLNAEFEDLN